MNRLIKEKKEWKYANIAAIGGIIFAVCMIGFLIGKNPSMVPFIDTSDYYCSRTEPYSLNPEFERALSLVRQRQWASGTQDKHKNIINCLNIQYGDLANLKAEGIFYFDQNSTTEDLRIVVDNSYKDYDDILTAVLLSHEIIHAGQFVLEKHGITNLSCFEKEEQAYRMQLSFITSLNDEEAESLNNRIANNPGKNSAYAGIYYLTSFNNIAYQECGSTGTACFNTSVERQIKDMVENSSGYQEQCS